jgi:type I restriction enzyme S subunit
VARIEALAAKIEEARILRQQAAAEAAALGKSAAAAEFIAGSGVERRPIRSFVSVVGGGTPSKSNPFFWGGDIPWVTPKDMKVRNISGATDRITSDAVKGSAAKLIEPGAVLVVVRGMILAHTFPSAVLRVSATINQDMKALRANNSVTPEYLCNALWALNRDLLDRVEKSTHDTRKFETDKLLDFELPVPPLVDQRRIVAYLDGLQAKVDALKQLQSETAAELDALLPAILDQAFKGEL